MSEYHVIFGTGPVGCWTARTLRDKDIPVRAINRSGNRPVLMPDDVQVIAADASDPEQAVDVARDAAVIYQALNPPYHKWREHFPGLQAGAMAAARAAEARYVSIENLYMYDPAQPMVEDSPVRPRSKKGELRAQMADEVMAAHQRGEIEAAALRSSDYYGPGVVDSALGARVFGNLLSGKKAQLTGSAGTPHSWAYIEDVGRAAAILGTSDDALGEVWIAPHATPSTQQEMLKIAARDLGVEPQYSVVSPLLMRLAGLFVPAARESVEMMYEFTEPFIVDSSKFEKAFGMQARSMNKAIKETLVWFRSHLDGAD